ncbi:MAG: hypothetical protein NVSMB12_03080 [Acidimicrobiales bacterium]
MRRALPLLLLAGAAACAVIGLTHQSGAALSGGPPVPPPATPVISARRLPTVVAGLVADQKLAARLAGVLASGGAGSQACLQVQLAGVPVYAAQPDTPLLPASNVKLLTAYAALTKLGADAVLPTVVVAPKPPVNGVVDGPLTLIGGGDPFLATAEYRKTQTEWTLAAEPVTKLEDLADRVKSAGVTHVTGGVLGDDTRFDAQRTIPTWKASYLATGEIGPVGALEVDGGFTVTGRRKAPDANPAAGAATVFTGLLRARGITVDGAPGVAPAPAGAAKVAEINSLSVRQIVGIMLRESDNLAAEMLVKELGHRFGGAGTWSAGLGVVRDVVAAAGVPVDGLALVDGSGLDRSDRISCATLAGLVATPSPAGAAVIGGLPRAGNCGTLAKRFLGQPAAGRIRAKTGSLTGVAALTGYVDAAPVVPAPPCPPPDTGAPAGAAARPVTFALLANGLGSDSAGLSLEDRVADALVSFPELPPLELFGP